MVFAFDQVGYNDTMQAPHEFGEKPEERIWGFGPLGLQLWNGIRALDFIASLPGVESANGSAPPAPPAAPPRPSCCRPWTTASSSPRPPT